MLDRNEKFLLTMRDDLIDQLESESEPENEVNTKIHEMMYKSNAQTKSLYC